MKREELKLESRQEWMRRAVFVGKLARVEYQTKDQDQRTRESDIPINQRLFDS